MYIYYIYMYTLYFMLLYSHNYYGIVIGVSEEKNQLRAIRTL